VREVTETAPRLAAAALRELVELVGDDHVIIDADRLAGYSVDWTGRFVGHAAAVVRPGSVAECAAVVDWARRCAVALVPQGGNTGLVGGSVPLAGEVVVSTSRLTVAGPVDRAARQITLGAGCTLASAQHIAAAHGLRVPVDLAARDSATIGGMVATNAGGLSYLRFGGMREQIVGIEAVLGNGCVIDDLRGLGKDNTGYHLPGLLCGSEGTLGIVTAARIRLVGAPSHIATALVAFDDVESAIGAAQRWAAANTDIESLELMIDSGMRLVCEQFALRPPFAADHAAYVLVEAAGGVDTEVRLASTLGADGVAAAVSFDTISRQRLWRYRDEHTSAVNRLGPPLKLDITTPPGQLADFVTSIADLVAEAAPGSATWLFGHVGDGNIHVNVTGAGEHAQQVERVVLADVAGRGGSISAEHGIGAAKRSYLHLRRSAAELEAMRAIKRALDPDGVMNPGVLLPSPPLPGANAPNSSTICRATALDGEVPTNYD
jgi:FAD/FMN-containing dehydrogenase